MINIESLIDEIYEAAAVPEMWPRVLDRLSVIPKAVGGLLFATDLRHAQWVASASITPIVDAFEKGGWMAKNSRPQRLASMRYAGFVSEYDVYTPEELEREPVYVDALRKYGLGWAAGTLFPMPSGDLLVFSFERAYDRGPIEREAVLALDRFRPHLARAGLLAWRLGLRRAQSMVEALELVGLPAAVLRESGRVSAVNPLFARLIPTVAQDRQDRLRLTHPPADALLGEALGRLASSTKKDGVQSIPLIGRDGQSPLVVHVLPVRRTAQDIFTQATSIVIVTPVDRASVPTAEILEGLFDLTPAEARVARAIGAGQTVDEIALTGGVSVGTVRGQLKAVLAKTGVGRQAELALLLSGLAL